MLPIFCTNYANIITQKNAPFSSPAKGSLRSGVALGHLYALRSFDGLVCALKGTFGRQGAEVDAHFPDCTLPIMLALSTVIVEDTSDVDPSSCAPE